MALSDEITILHDLATNYLRLTMHFFYPIQQCAQQIYHTALPLSPTSSHLQKYYLQSVPDDQLSNVTAFIGAPNTWGLLLRTIDVRTKKLTCITTSGQRIIAGCGDIVNIYDAVTGILQQTLSASESVTKIQTSPDGSTLFFAHSSSVTMWDVQTGGLIHTFTTQPEVNDVALSASGDHIASGSSDGSVRFWSTRTKVEGKGFGNGQPVVTVCWLSPQKLAVATQNCLYIRDVVAGRTLENITVPDRVWGMLYFEEKDEFLVGTSRPGLQADQELYSLEIISHQRPKPFEKRNSAVDRGQPAHRSPAHRRNQSPTLPGQLMRPTIVGKEIACITPPSGVQSFSTESFSWTNNPPLLSAATSVTVSLNRNLVVQNQDSIQIFSVDVLTSRELISEARPPRVHPLGKKHALSVLQPDRHLILFELETLRELHPDDVTLPFESSSPTQSPSSPPCPELVVDLLEAVQMWRSGTPLPRQAEIDDEAKLLYEFSPACTKLIVVLNRAIGRRIWLHDAKSRSTLAVLDRGDSSLGDREVYDITFDSESRFYLEVDGPGQHVKIPYDITAPLSDTHCHTITEGNPVRLSKPQAPPYILDANCEWVLDVESKKICWIPSGNIRRGGGGHVWAGSTLVMVGDDGVVRKISFREPDC